MLGDKQASQPSTAPGRAMSPDFVHSVSTSSNAGISRQLQQSTSRSSGCTYLPPHKRQQAPSVQQPSIQQTPRRSRISQSSSSIQQLPNGQGTPQTIEFAVQIYFDMSSVTAVNQSHQHLHHLSGHWSPDHHNYTAIHEWIARICPQLAGAFGADVWLDTFHATVGELHIAKDSVSDVQREMRRVCGSLQPVTSLEYVTGELRETKKANRLKKEIKGDLFYHVGLKSAAAELDHILQPWVTAVQNIAAQTGATFTVTPFQKHHITIRCHTKKQVPRDVFMGVCKAINDNPVVLKVAGFRVQLAASQALEHYGEQHITKHIDSDGSEVTYPVPIYTSGPPASALIEQSSHTDEASETRATTGSDVPAVSEVVAAAAAAVVDQAALSLQFGQNCTMGA